MAVLEDCQVEGTVNDLKMFGFQCQNNTCIYFKDYFSLSRATKDPHFLLDCIQLSRSQAGIKQISAVIDGVTISLMCN